jgi:hypothetical protein
MRNTRILVLINKIFEGIFKLINIYRLCISEAMLCFSLFQELKY